MKRFSAIRSLSRARQIVLVVGLLAVLTGGGIAVAVAADGGGATAHDYPFSTRGGSIAYAPTVSSPPPIAASTALRQVVDSLRNGRSAVGDKRSAIVSARIGTSVPRGIPPARNADVPALYVTVKFRHLTIRYTSEPLWEADLLEGALVELAGSHRSLENDIGYIEYRGQLPDGKVIPNLAVTVGNVARGQYFAGSNDTDAEIKDSIERAASALGLTVRSVTIFHAIGAAPAVVLTAPPNPRAAVVPAELGSLQEKLFGSPPRYEGYYLEIRGKNGKLYGFSSFSYLSGAGRSWFDPSVS